MSKEFERLKTAGFFLKVKAASLNIPQRRQLAQQDGESGIQWRIRAIQPASKTKTIYTWLTTSRYSATECETYDLSRLS